jgi:hypothetical protein
MTAKRWREWRFSQSSCLLRHRASAGLALTEGLFLMWIVAIAWMYVALMMALAEATSPQGTVLGALVTFFFYGLGPLALLMYIMGTPGRRRARLQAEAQPIQTGTASSGSSTGLEPDAGSLAPGSVRPAKREEP